jgi:tetratricopeptide (TPR) repeat protein
VIDSTDDPFVGRTIGQYQILARVGGGGMGVVYTARAGKLGRLVALKFLPPQWSHDDTARQRFLREAQAASATNHPNICTIHDIETADDGQLFIVMAYYEGETLKKRLERGPLPVAEALEIASNVAEGLAKAHAQGVVHRDIKPGNLILTEDGVRILDFGLATFADALKLTAENAAVGTIAYMSPEQVRGLPADARSDVWAVGAVLYEMLTGHPPFQGSHAEAIAYAIRNEAPLPVRANRPEVPEDVEQLVFRALHKEPSVRYASGRELARALRHCRGQSIPLDLRTDVVPSPAHVVDTPTPTRRFSRTAAIAAAVVCVLAAGAAAWWLLAQTERTTVAVVPFLNHTGYAELDQYRMALTLQVIERLEHMPGIRVLSYNGLASIVRRYRAPDADISSREAIEAIATHSGAPLLLVPMVFRENGQWKARAEFRRPDTATAGDSVQTAGLVSSLPRDAVFDSSIQLTDAIGRRLIERGSIRAALGIRLRRLLGTIPTIESPRLRSLDAAAAFERALDAVDEQEYSVAWRAIAAAATEDSRSPLLQAWSARIAGILRRSDDAGVAADRAMRLLSDSTSATERLFTEAVVAEARRDFKTAESRYRSLIAAAPDEAKWLMELAGFQDRRGAGSDAAGSYVEVLRLEPMHAAARAELCRLYGPNGLNEGVKAREHGTAALAAYRALGDRAGEAISLLCLADTLRTGSADDRRMASTHVAAATRILETSQSEYQLPRAYSYAALIAGVEGRFDQSIALGERALAGARAAGNAVLTPVILMNLGVSNALAGHRDKAVEHYRESSHLFEALGEDQRAAQSATNAASLVINGGGDVETALRDVENALVVFRKKGNRQFEVFCLRLLGNYNRYAGRYADAIELLNQATALVKEHGLRQNTAFVWMDLASTHAERGEYEAARLALEQAYGDGTGADAPRVRLLRAQTLARLGAIAEARHDVTAAQTILDSSKDTSQRRLFHTTAGLVAFEAGELDQARTQFRMAVQQPGADQADASRVEALAYLGLLDAQAGQVADARTGVQASLAQAVELRRIAAEVRARVFLARIELGQRKLEAASRLLAAVPADTATRSVGGELRAQVTYWESELLRARGEEISAHEKRDLARQVLVRLRDALPAQFRAGFAARPEIRRILD